MDYAATRVLLVDPDPAFAAEAAASLERAGMDASREPDPERALSRLDSSVTDCLVCEHGLPVGAGRDLFEAARERRPDLPVVVFTARGSEDVAGDVLAAGADGYVPKAEVDDANRFDLLATRVADAVARCEERREVGRGDGGTARSEGRTPLERDPRTLEAALDAVDDCFFLLDETGRPVFWNDRVGEITGYDEAELASMSLAEFFDDGDAAVVRDAVDRMLREGSVAVEADVVTAAGERVPFEFRGVRMTDEYGSVVGGCGIGRNVGGQRAYERDLERYRALMEAMGDAVYVVDETGTLLDVNRSLVEASGYDRSELLGANVAEFMDTADVEAVTELVVDVLSDPERSSGSIEFETVDADGRTRTVEDSVSVLTDDDGGYVSTVGVLRDVTEERTRKRQLRRQNERLDRFAGLVSHDLRNPINVVQGFVDLAEESGDPEAFDRIRAAADRMEALVDDMLVLARNGTVVGERTPVSLASVATDAWDGVGTEGARLVVGDDRTLEADPDRLAALFENLYRNSLDHGAPDGMPGATDAGRPLTVRVEATDAGFAVADDGVGLPEDRSALFDYGVSHDGGTGLGLAIVEEICEAHGWRVEATDAASGGARFEVRF